MRDEHGENRANGNGNLPPAEYRWKPGQSGNPKGRPKGSGLSDRLREVLDADDGAALDAIVRAVVDAAAAGDAQFVRMIWERLEGKVSQRIETAGVSHYKVHYAEDVRGAI